ncbi:hypothetical protein C9F11_37405 [Streptomyces sp. YIM 121038]|uniref:hypothetical protein n=1 Tax=Streptomyces sp. YIM 121038 TaxID=2136401 RepID=UPI001110BC83|nr:hypothetical protein [Streptomyces sp. YIM 121038]QCX81064.1 hypothetical protein C9F11_37405 [Streptomyces sp. YIM 121038]
MSDDMPDCGLGDYGAAHRQAHEAVLREMLRNNPDLDEQRADDLIEALLDEAAHLMAEEQRAMAKHHAVSLDSGGEVSMADLINWIDPRVPESEGGRPRQEG